MGKKQVRQVRQQMRKVQPKTAGSNAPGATRKQRERYVQSGGMLQGYAPDYVIRIGYVSIGIAVLCALVIAACRLFIPPIYGWPVAVAASLAWVLPIALLASFVGPGFRLALKDRRTEARLVPGQLGGAGRGRPANGPGRARGEARRGVEQHRAP